MQPLHVHDFHWSSSISSSLTAVVLLAALPRPPLPFAFLGTTASSSSPFSPPSSAPAVLAALRRPPIPFAFSGAATSISEPASSSAAAVAALRFLNPLSASAVVPEMPRRLCQHIQLYARSETVELTLIVHRQQLFLENVPCCLGGLRILVVGEPCKLLVVHLQQESALCVGVMLWADEGVT